MAETLGMLCDKLTLIKLKNYNMEDGERFGILPDQPAHLREEMDPYLKEPLNLFLYTI